jgi:hypothetical protein
LFGSKSRAERIKEEARGTSLVPALANAYGEAKPVVERLLYDDDLRENIRTFIESTRKILNELSDEGPNEIVARLWDDDKLRREVEAAAGAAQEGVKRIQGQRVKGNGAFGRVLLVLALAGGGGYLFLSPRTGSEARRIAREAIGALRS